jgi:hypothetical protein
MTSRRDFLGRSLLSLSTAALAPSVLLSSTSTLSAQEAGGAQAIPESNRASLTEPPRRPPLGDVPERMRRLLVESCIADAPAPSHELFLSREAFRLIKAISDPDALYDRIFRAYEEDIHELHARLLEESGGDLAEVAFVGFRFTGRRGWVRLREETNRLPYWAQRHSWIDYTVRGRPHQIEVRTMIAWGDRWFITHLNEFR